MNMQAMLKQAQNMQKEMMKAQNEINNMIFEAKNGLVTIKMKGSKEIESVHIDKDFSSEDVEMLEDMIVLAVNNAIEQVNKVTEEKLGKYTKGIPGLF